MTIELQLLGWALCLGLVHLLLTVPVTIAQHGIGWVFGPRDDRKALTGIGARLSRAFENFMETLPLFIGAVLLANATEHHSGLTVAGSQTYLVARIVYIPIYLSGLPVVRTLAWIAGFAGIAMVLAGALYT